MTPDEARRATSEHEAAHASAAVLLGLDVHSVAVGDVAVHADPGARLVGLTAVPVDVRDADELRRRAVATLVPLVDEPGGAPDWPLPHDPPPGGDIAQVAAIVKALGIDAVGYRRLAADALAVSLRDDYRALRDRLAALAERHGYLDADAVKTATERITMRHKRFELADVDVLDEGELIGFASTYDRDLVNDRVVPGAFREAVAAIKSGKPLPLIWSHDANSPTNWVGRIVDADETSEGLRIRARFDLDDAAGRKAWRLARDGDITSLSIGYSVPPGGQRRAKDGANELTRIDLREVSLVLTPANPQARVLAVKQDADLDDLRDLDDVISRAFDAAERDADLRRKTAEHAAYIDEFAPVRVRRFEA